MTGNPFSDEMNQVVRREAGGVTLPQVPTKGQGVVRTSLGSAAPPFEVDWLTDAYPDHPDAKQPFQAYDDKVKALFFARLDTLEKQKTESPYLGAQACIPCHVKPAATWKKTRHAGAIGTLEKVGKQFDPECLACHVVGLNRGGYLSKDLTPQLAGVQCENCHGPGRAHSLNPKANRTGSAFLFPPARAGGTAAQAAEKICRGCHVGSHSPAFDFKVYWPKIQHKLWISTGG